MNLTDEQQRVAQHPSEVFVEACPGAGKTRTVVARLARIAKRIPPRRGIALLSFTNSAVEEFIRRCLLAGLEGMLDHPSFVGTFDSFSRHFFIAPAGIDGVNVRPIVVDSWDTIDIEIRLRGRNAFPGPGVSLDNFDPRDNQINAAIIGHTALRAHVVANQAAYVRAAEQRRRNLRRNGHLSAADARIEVQGRLRDENWSHCLGRALAARFHEIIVDEAQDCNPLDLQVLQWLRDHGLPVVIVTDPDQAIYGFRHGDPADVRRFAQTYAPANRLELTGNFRSTRPICSLASTLRARAVPDSSTGENAIMDIPVRILVYNSHTVPPMIGEKFAELVACYGIDPAQSIILAHARTAACRAAGVVLPSADAGTSRIATLAKQLSEFWASTASNRTREGALRAVERILLKLMDKIDDDESSTRSAEKHGIDQRWLRRTALDFLTRLPRSCEDSNAGRTSWITTVHREVDRLGLQYGPNLSARGYFRQPRTSEWSKHLRQSDFPRLKWSTIHEAKGREFDAVCVVLPPDRGNTTHTSKLFEVWESRVDDEAKRVVYVAVTRAKKLIMVAVPTAFSQRLVTMLNQAGVSVEVS